MRNSLGSSTWKVKVELPKKMEKKRWRSAGRRWRQVGGRERAEAAEAGQGSRWWASSQQPHLDLRWGTRPGCTKPLGGSMPGILLDTDCAGPSAPHPWPALLPSPLHLCAGGFAWSLSPPWGLVALLILLIQAERRIFWEVLASLRLDCSLLCP